MLKSILRSRQLLLLFLPCLLYFLIFKYYPMYGVLIAFKDYNLFKGFTESPWVGLKYFEMFFNNPDALELIRNTFLIGLYSLIWGFPAGLVLALVLNEVKKASFKKLVQIVSYLPHFLSTVVVSGMVVSFLAPRTGLINVIIAWFGGEPIHFLAEPEWFRTIYVASGIWQGMGWGAIIYLASLSGIDPHLYEAAVMDGANKFKQLIHVTLPCIAPTIMTLFILETGWVLTVGFEKVFLLYNPATYETADVIETYVYRVGIIGKNFSYATAIGLFVSLVSLVFLYTTNYLSKKFSDTSLW
ncbi:ABC transporter permease [Paenibacillaceae bacterium WGS1546]|uniref:ABC transporter permease n=1 Tax=Cohnella sp. WGS1546 TaxID=3366810 RepID=UPI00372CFB25